MDQRTLNGLADELRVALTELGLPARVQPDVIDADGLGHLQVHLDDTDLDLVVLARAALRPPAAGELPDVDGIGLVFADRLAERTRDVLRDRGWGWLDRRRGHLRLWTPGARIDASITPTAAPPSTRVRNPFSASGQQLALWLLMHPHEPASPRAIARELDVSAGQVSNLLTALDAQALLQRDRTPLVPELFWALAEHWHPRRHAVASLPSLDALAAAPELKVAQWVVGDSLAAAAFGAPVALSGDYPPDLYVPDAKVLSWMLNRCERAADPGQRVATLAVAPIRLLHDRRFVRPDPDDGPWPLAHPVVVALDLAAERGRGREVLDGWTPGDEVGAERVW